MQEFDDGLFKFSEVSPDSQVSQFGPPYPAAHSRQAVDGRIPSVVNPVSHSVHPPDVVSARVVL